MHVFLSSVRRGLEVERDSLPGLIAAVGHEAVRFEDLTAKPEPPREVCVRAAADCDVYLLLLGGAYGHVFPETGQSATHDEFMAARAAGVRCLAFVQEGVAVEPRQAELIDQVESYGEGLFRDSFRDATDLQARVVSALREVERAPSPLTYSPLHEPVELRWLRDEPTDRSGLRPTSGAAAALELHVMPLAEGRRSQRLLAELPQRIVSGLRSASLLAFDAAVTPSTSRESAQVLMPASASGAWDSLRPGELRGVRVDASGQVTVWWSLPSDGMGAILDQVDITRHIAQGLRLVGTLDLVAAAQLVVAAGVDPLGRMVSVGRVAEGPRTRAELHLGQGAAPLRTEPDESVSLAALGKGADDVAPPLAAELVRALAAAR